MSGNPFAPGSSFNSPSAVAGLQQGTAGAQQGTAGAQSSVTNAQHANADPFKASQAVSADPFAASNYPPAKTLSKAVSLDFPDTSNKVEEYSFAELNPTQFAQLPPRQATVSSEHNTLGSAKAGANSSGFPVNFATEPPAPKSEGYHQFPQNPLYQGPSGTSSFANTPRLPTSQEHPVPQHPRPENGGLTGFQGYSYPQNAQPQGREVISHQGSSASDAAGLDPLDPFAGLTGLQPRSRVAPPQASDPPTTAVSQPPAHFSPPQSSPRTAWQGPQPPLGKPPPHGGIFPDNFNGANDHFRHGGAFPESFNVANDHFRSHNPQSFSVEHGRISGGGDQELRGNALTRPFYPAGDLRTAQPVGNDPQAEKKLWDFTQLDVIRAARKSMDDEAKKENQVPMRPNSNRQSWTPNWATFDEASEPGGPQQNNVQHANGSHPPVTHQHMSHQTLAVDPRARDPTNQPGANGQLGDDLDSFLVAAPAPPLQAAAQPTPQQSPQPTPRAAPPAAPIPQVAPAKAIPWALSPPRNDPLKPRVQGEGAFAHSSQSARQSADLSTQMRGLSVDKKVPEAWRNLSESDAALARKLQAQWDKEEANQAAGITPVAAPFNLLKRSAVAGKTPTPEELAAARRSIGDPEVQNRAQAFLARVGASTSEDAEFARKLQAEYDNEAASRSRTNAVKANQGTYAMTTQSQGPTHNAFQSLQPQHSIHDDEMYAHKLQQDEIRRSQAYSSGIPQQPQHLHPQQGHGGPSYPSPHQQGGQGYPQGSPQGYPRGSQGYPQGSPQGYPQQPHPQHGYSGQGTGYQGQQAYDHQGNFRPLRHTEESQNYPTPPAWHVRQPSIDQPSHAHQGAKQEMDDEALARQLQQQYDKESLDMVPRQNPNPRPADSTTSVPLGSKPSKPKLAFWKRADKLLAPPPESICAGCKQPVYSLMLGGRHVKALGSTWHPDADCFCCGLCKKPITDGEFQHDKNIPYHTECHKQAFHPRCCVCTDFLPSKDGGIRWTTDKFWKYKACEAHNTDGTSKCYSCNRLQPRNEEWISVNSAAEAERKLCLECVGTIVVDTRDAQPLYDDVLRFFAQQGMALPSKPPLLLVEPTALESAEMQEQRHHTLHNDPVAPVFHTRGLTLSMEYQRMKTVTRRGQSWFPEFVTIPESRHSEVTAILVLAGLPRLLTGSILAHECMHAWLRLTSSPPLSRQVEEGLCQLMAYLWLQTQPDQPKGSHVEKLQSFCEHQIRNERSVDYGDGFRAALDALNRLQIPVSKLIEHCKSHNQFP